MGTATDSDLTSLFRSCSDEELKPILDDVVDVISETITSAEKYNANKERPSQLVDEIVYEIRTLGGNSIANWFRDAGIDYSEIVSDVFGELGVKQPKPDDTASREELIIQHLFDETLRQLNVLKLKKHFAMRAFVGLQEYPSP